MVLLIRNGILALDQANRANDYSVLRGLAAPAFQAMNTPADLAAAFKDLRSRNLQLSQVAVTNPRLNAEPEIDRNGLLHLVGFFPDAADQVDFNLVFQMIQGRWLLFGLAVSPPQGDAKPSAAVLTSAVAATIPDSAKLVDLVRDAVVSLNQANVTGEYSVLRAISSTGFQTANSAARLGELFATLRNRHLDLSPVTVIEPRLYRAPAIDKDGYLRLTGYFPSAPERVNFDLAFKFEASDWRLFGIGLNTSQETSTENPPSGDDRNASQSLGPMAPAAPSQAGGVPAAVAR